MNNAVKGGGGGGGRSMAADPAPAATPEETLAALLREAEVLKQRLEEERQKLNDVTLSSVAERLEQISFPTLKDGKVTIWDAFTATREQTIATPSTWTLACAWAPSGACVAAGGLDNKVTVWALGEGEEPRKRSVGTHAGYVAAALFPHTDRQLLTAAGDGSCALWDVEAGQLLQGFAAHAADALALHLAPSDLGDTFASGGGDRAVRVWDVRAGAAVRAFDAHPSDVTAVRFHPAGDALASGCDDAACRLFDLRADRELARYARPSALFPVTSAEWSLSGRLLVAGYGDHTAAVWDSLRAARVGVLNGHEHRVARVVLAPDGTALATASWDTTVRVWA